MPDFDNIIQYCVKKQLPVYKDSKWVIEWDIVEKTQETIDFEKISIEKSVRNERDNKLSETDWVVTKSLEKSEPIPQTWLDYRQELRDITLQDGFPYNIVWPNNP